MIFEHVSATGRIWPQDRRQNLNGNGMIHFVLVGTFYRVLRVADDILAEDGGGRSFLD